jgi:hypothetical protein
MYSLKIKDIKRERNIATGEQFLDVEVSILKSGKFAETRKFAYPIDTKEASIKSDLERFLETHQQDIARGEANKAADEANANAEKTVSKLKGFALEGKAPKAEKKSKK